MLLQKITKGWKPIIQKCLQMHSSSGQKIPTIQEVIDSLFVTVGGQKTYNYSQKLEDRSYLENILPKSQTELPPRRMADSHGEAIIPLETDLMLRDKYISFVGGVRFGRLLEDLDVFAVWLCYKHVSNPKQEPGSPSPFCIVTALVDHIEIPAKKLRPDRDIRLSGQVTWVGRTSMEITMDLEQTEDSGQWQNLMTASFVMVARDPLNRGSAFINPMIAETTKDKRHFQEGEVHKLRRQELAEQSLMKIPPSVEEKALVHDLFLSTVIGHNFKIRNLPENCRWMDTTVVNNAIICHPQARNFYNKVFGGFLMRQALEVAWTTAYLFRNGCLVQTGLPRTIIYFDSKARPFICHVDDIWFRKPVDIGSVLNFSSQVVYVEENDLQIRVSADVLNPMTEQQETTNIFHFTFTSSSEKPPPKVMPKTYSEAMMYIDGKRHYAVSRGRLKYTDIKYSAT